MYAICILFIYFDCLHLSTILKESKTLNLYGQNDQHWTISVRIVGLRGLLDWSLIIIIIIIHLSAFSLPGKLVCCPAFACAKMNTIQWGRCSLMFAIKSTIGEPLKFAFAWTHFRAILATRLIRIHFGSSYLVHSRSTKINTHTQQHI